MPDLWELVTGKPQIDPQRLADALEDVRPGMDYRTRLLIRDSAQALEHHWGAERWSAWLAKSRSREAIDAVRQEGLQDFGFPHVEGALMDRTDPETVRQFLRELGMNARKPAERNIG